jgi:hypothetical protein
MNRNLILEIKKAPERLKRMRSESGKGYIFLITDYLLQRFKNGLEFNEYHDFEFDRQNKAYRRSYLNTKEKLKYLSFLNSFDRYYTLARNKYLTHIYLKSLNIPVAKLFYYYDPRMNTSEKEFGNKEVAIISALRKSASGQFVVKPAEGKWGQGVMVYNGLFEKDGRYYLQQWDKTEIRLQNVLGRKSLLFEEKVEQTEQLKKINASSLNTLRIVTALYPDGNVDMIRGFLKFGRSSSCISNRGDGENIAATVDLDSGLLKNPGHFKAFRNIVPVKAHPDSKQQLDGLVIENWGLVRKQIMEYHRRITFLKVLAWDIAITDIGAVVIEINDLFDNAGQIITGKGWKKDVENCYRAWKNYRRPGGKK